MANPFDAFPDAPAAPRQAASFDSFPDVPQIDFNRPVEAVRADMAKLSGVVRETALRDWADHFVSKEAEQSGPGLGIENLYRTVARGSMVGPFLDEANAATAGALHAVSGGYLGRNYDEVLAYQRARDRAFDKEYPILSAGTQLATGVATAIPAIIGTGGTAAPGVGANIARLGRQLVSGPVAQAAPAATVAGRLGQASAVGAGYGATAGFGNAEGGIGNRAEGAVVGGLVGGVLGGGIGIAGEGVRQVARARANMGEAGAYGRIADDLPGGPNQLSDEIAAGASRNNVVTNRRTLDILGEEMQNAGGDVAQAQQAAIARIAQEAGVTPQTAAGQIRRLTQVHRDSNLMLGEYPAVSASDRVQRQRQPGNVDLDELGRTTDSTTQAKLDYLANNGNAQSAQDVRNAITQRQEGLAPAMRETLAGVGPQVQTGQNTFRPATIVDSEALQDAARLAGTTAYNVAHNAPMAVQPGQLQNAIERFVQIHSNRANSRAGEVGDAIITKGLREFFERDPMTGNILRDNAGRPVIIDVMQPGGLQRLQDARASIGAILRKAHQDGDNNIVAALQPMYHDTRPNVRTGARWPDITRIMERASPQWGVANRAWADMNFLEMAERLGDAFANKAGPQFRQQMQEFANLAPEAQNIVRIHFLQKQFDKLDNLGDSHSVSKLFTNDHSRNMIRAIFGDEAAVAFTRAVRDQRVAEASQRMMANSATHRRGQAQRQMDSETGLVSAVQNASARGVRNWIMDRAAQILTENRNRPMAGILTTPMNDTARVAQHLYRMRQQQNVIDRLDVPSQTPLAVSAATAGTASDIIQNQRRER